MKIKVLLAEDDCDDMDIFLLFLGERSDISFCPCVENGLEVHAFLDAIINENDLPDIIILDHNMPKMNGKVTLDLLKANHKYQHIPVIIYSTYVDEHLTDSCMKAGAAMVVEKPSTAEGYHMMMDEVLHHVLAIGH